MASFQKAQRRNAKLRLAISGTSGAGKTYSALLMAKVLGKKIAVLDSEKRSAELYSDLVDFDVCPLEDATIQEYRAKIREAAEDGYDVLVIDSYSHSWMAALDVVTAMGGWVKAGKVVTPMIARLVSDILSYPGHVIATMRSTSDVVIDQDEKGRNVPKKVGMKTVARDGTDYEFTVMLDVTKEGGLTVSKTRCSAIADGVYTRDDVTKIATKLKTWLSSGAEETALDRVVQKLQFASSNEQLSALVPELKALTLEERKSIKAQYEAKKAEIAQAADELGET